MKKQLQNISVRHKAQFFVVWFESWEALPQCTSSSLLLNSSFDISSGNFLVLRKDRVLNWTISITALDVLWESLWMIGVGNFDFCRWKNVIRKLIQSHRAQHFCWMINDMMINDLTQGWEGCSSLSLQSAEVLSQSKVQGRWLRLPTIFPAIVIIISMFCCTNLVQALLEWPSVCSRYTHHPAEKMEAPEIYFVLSNWVSCKLMLLCTAHWLLRMHFTRQEHW